MAMHHDASAGGAGQELAMTRVPPIMLPLVLMVAAGIGPARADGLVKHEITASSSALVTVAADGTVAMQARNARLVPYTLFALRLSAHTVLALEGHFRKELP
jgi:hypothetical protein